MRRSLFLATVSWMLSALAHGISLVALGLFAGNPDLEGVVRVVNPIELAGSFAVEPPRQPVLQLTSWEAVASSEASAAPPLLANAAPPAEPPSLPAPEPQTPSAPPPDAPPPAAIVETQLFGLRGRGNRFVYVFDRSSSMEGAPLAAAKRELIASLSALTAANQFQVVFYNHQPLPMPALRGGAVALAAADDQGKRRAGNFIGSIFADGATDHMAALQMALAMRPDVIFLLTDANDPRLSPAELDALRRLNRQTAIHTIEFGVGPSQWPDNFLRDLAMENGGQHTYIDLLLLQSRMR